jgi:hypothetical protein
LMESAPYSSGSSGTDGCAAGVVKEAPNQGQKPLKKV